MTDYLEKAKELLKRHESNAAPYADLPERATAFATIAVAELLQKQQEPVKVEALRNVPTVEDRDKNFLPGDVVGLTISEKYYSDYNGRHGVVTYTDDESGYQVSFCLGTLRCSVDELTMITRREDRTPETDRTDYLWKERK